LAYADATGEHHYYDAANKTLYISGTNPLDVGDLFADAMIPLGMLSKTPRYQQMERLIDVYHPTTLVGHSLAGSEVLEYQHSHPDIHTRTYGAPVLSFSPSSERYGHWFDPVSMFDFGKISSFASGLNPHSFEGFG